MHAADSDPTPTDLTTGSLLRPGFDELLRSWLRQRKLNQKDATVILDTDAGTLSRWLNGGLPQSHRVGEIARALGVDYEVVIDAMAVSRRRRRMARDDTNGSASGDDSALVTALNSRIAALEARLVAAEARLALLERDTPNSVVGARSHDVT